MKQFEFRLQKVMETTKTRQELKKRELAKALAVLTQNELLLEGMLERLEEQIEQFDSRRFASSMKASEMLNFSNYTERLLTEIQQQKRMIEELVERVRQHREKLLEISKDKKILERLKEKKYEEYRKKLRSMEQKFMDELGARAFQIGKEEGQ
ncbi:MAG: flagellar export protein FliJ [Candidatus Glassbacteria bacterium RIFCSPLOWO2_12_FULL_58_11]|uniref:Flagellar FliJ protein n=2 Tax=Candidatus Glassiibacteriota TaxID=1817805 RepID=A0A1F5YLP6_9BACT|nr:MAG: flagellar export protein FliJ [Candidatus Glassbacteria bacterium GWA2_58_10]OGG00973.1 MAG: flagellar export protein FliJ [Candidatus Glassbacteria bacterium RIFCSPLOWO2_12_FULL_58_11]